MKMSRNKFLKFINGSNFKDVDVELKITFPDDKPRERHIHRRRIHSKVRHSVEPKQRAVANKPVQAARRSYPKTPETETLYRAKLAKPYRSPVEQRSSAKPEPYRSAPVKAAQKPEPVYESAPKTAVEVTENGYLSLDANAKRLAKEADIDTDKLYRHMDLLAEAGVVKKVDGKYAYNKNTEDVFLAIAKEEMMPLYVIAKMCQASLVELKTTVKGMTVYEMAIGKLAGISAVDIDDVPEIVDSYRTLRKAV